MSERSERVMEGRTPAERPAENRGRRTGTCGPRTDGYGRTAVTYGPRTKISDRVGHRSEAPGHTGHRSETPGHTGHRTETSVRAGLREVRG